MKVLYIHQHFTTPKVHSSRSYWISQELIRRGYEVTMIANNYPGQANKSLERTNVDGINVIYLKVPYNQRMSVFRRFFSFIQFMIKSTWFALKETNVDLVIATSTPLTIGFPALVVKKLKGTPFLFEVRDLWPEVPIQMGALNNRLARNLAIWFEKTLYRNATHVVALSPGMREGVLKHGINEERVSMIPNMSKVDIFWNREKDMTLIAELGLKTDSFKVIYFGSMGLANGMDYIIEAIKHLKNEKNIEFLFAGGGATETDLKAKCKNLGLENTHFLGSFPLHKLSEIVNLSDVSLITFANIPILATNSPNKLFDSLSAGRPIIVNSPGWTKAMVEDHHCGLFADPLNPSDLADKLLFLKNNPELVSSLGENARKLAESKYDKSILCDQFVKEVDKIISREKL